MGQTTGVLMGLRDIRRKRALTQVQLAGAAGVSQATIATAEKGRAVNVVSMRKIAAALGVTPEELQSGTKRRKRSSE